MSRRKIKDVVDLMRQDPERRLRDVAIPDEDTCRFCDSTILDAGPWHNEECPKYEELQDPEQEEDEEDGREPFTRTFIEGLGTPEEDDSHGD